MSHRPLSPSRTSSTKTRIETKRIQFIAKEEIGIKNKFHENKDWNRTVADMRTGGRPAIKNKFHENKDWNKTRLLGFRLPWPSRTSSTKTRIETDPEGYHARFSSPIKNKFHENKDWNQYASFRNMGVHGIKNKFHENKDWNL